MGYTHIELMPIMEHPFDASWGYQTVGYFAVTSRFGTPDDFMYFVDRCHQEGIGVILDWTPAHFPRDAHGLAFFDGTHLYEHADPRMGAHPDWGTLVFNYGRNEVQNFLLSNALFWLDKYHIDGLRVDAVASMLYLDYSRKPGEWIPNAFGGRENLEAIAFLKQLERSAARAASRRADDRRRIHIVARRFAPHLRRRPGLRLEMEHGLDERHAELSSHYDPIHRQYHHNELTFSMLYAFTENFVLPLSHDEVVHGKRSLLEKMPGDDWQKFANLRLLFGYMYAHPGKKLLFMGSELAQRNEFWEDGSVDWSLEDSPPHRGVQRLVADLNHLHAQEPRAARARFRMVRLRMDRSERRREQRAFLSAPRKKSGRCDRRRLQFHARGARRLPRRRSPPRLLPRNSEYRFRATTGAAAQETRRRASRANPVERETVVIKSAPASARRDLF